MSGDTFLDRDSTRTKLGSVGRACLFLELDIWDDDDAPVPAGERGEVVLRGPKVFAGYWNDPDATATAFRGDGSTPATSACRTTTATCTSSIG